MDFRGYGGPPPGAGGQPDPLYGVFSSVAGQDGQISAEELQTCLTRFGITGSYKPFSLETCKLMISMLDADYSGSMGFTEFNQLMSALNAWKQNFMSMDQDRSGAVSAQEMQQALASQGYRLSPQVLNIIIKRYSVQGQIPFDEYVACCIKLRSLTQLFQMRDTTRQGSATFQYDDFIQCTMST